MRVLLEWDMPLEPFNSMVKDGTAGAAIEKALGAIKPEAAYFAVRDGRRGGTMVVDLADASKALRRRGAFASRLQCQRTTSSVHDFGGLEQCRS